MSLKPTQRKPALPKHLFDQSEKCFHVVRPHEPDLAVDGLARASVFERFVALFGNKKSSK
jgi:hypothetical protein